MDSGITMRPNQQSASQAAAGLNRYVLHYGVFAMRLSLCIFIISLVAVKIASAETVFNKKLIIQPQKTEAVVIATDVPLSFNAEFQDMSYEESKICGNCLHIKNILQGSVNTAASNLGVGFIFVQPVDGKISVDVYHDYKSPKIINVTATVYKGSFKLE